jgi:hypothetical protein
MPGCKMDAISQDVSIFKLVERLSVALQKNNFCLQQQQMVYAMK